MCYTRPRRSAGLAPSRHAGYHSGGHLLTVHDRCSPGSDSARHRQRRARARAFDGGAGTAALGLLLHYVIALVWTVLFFLAARRFGALTRHPIPVGLSYGVVVWAVMNLIVLPLSNARRGPFNLRRQPSRP